MSGRPRRAGRFEPMEVTFCYTPDDIKTYAVEHAAAVKQTRSGHWWRRWVSYSVYYAALMGVPVAGFILSGLVSPDGAQALTVLAVSFVIWKLLLDRLWRRVHLARLAKHPSLRGEHSHRLEAKGLWSTMADGEYVRYWSRYTDITLTTHHILFIAGAHSLPIPRRAVASPEEAQRFYDAAVTLWKQAAQWPPVPVSSGVQ